MTPVVQDPWWLAGQTEDVDRACLLFVVQKALADCSYQLSEGEILVAAFGAEEVVPQMLPVERTSEAEQVQFVDPFAAVAEMDSCSYWSGSVQWIRRSQSDLEQVPLAGLTSRFV